MTLKEFVKTLADRIARLEQSGGGGDVTKAYVDEQDTKLGNRISTLNTKVNTIKRDDIDPLTESVGTLQTDVGTLQGSMTTAQDDISTLQGDVQTLTDTMPTKTSDLENDSGFITSSALPTNTSELTNDSGFITANDTVANATHSTSSDSADVSTKAINDENGVNIANSLASITSDLNVLTKMKVLESGIKNYAYTLQVDCPSFGLLFCWYDSNYFLGYVGEFDGYKIMPLVKNADLATIDSSTRKITLPIAYTRFALVKIQQ